MKNFFLLVFLGILSGLLSFVALNSLEELRGFYTFLLLSATFSLIAILLYRAITKERRVLRLSLSFAFVFALAILTFVLILGFALTFEQAAFLHVRKVTLSNDCVQISEEDLENYAVLRKALKSAEVSGSAMIKITPDESRKLSKYYGVCVIYNGSAYEINVAVT